MDNLEDYSREREVLELSNKTAGDWPGTIAAIVVRSPRSKLCPSPFGGRFVRTLLVYVREFIDVKERSAELGEAAAD
jgi:hypothetical protein